MIEESMPVKPVEAEWIPDPADKEYGKLLRGVMGTLEASQFEAAKLIRQYVHDGLIEELRKRSEKTNRDAVGVVLGQLGWWRDISGGT